MQDIKNRVLDSVGEGKSEMIQDNSIKTCILSNMKQMTSPSSMHKTGHSNRCTGTTQRDGMGREVRGGLGLGGTLDTCTPMADSCQCMAKTTTIL